MFRGTCSKCGCEVEISEEEGKLEAGNRNYDQIYYTVKCPTKGCEMLIACHEFKEKSPDDPSDSLGAFQKRFAALAGKEV